ncbi:MAG: 4a-hydroxytetrahydrobiopterin dehydratase [SAR86 cluster bacterium]|uniref:4a-hydroxytetrahydrobiopterin dehydratase n=1 Tax=SAR86 cluster bacterium TaxID=2030880 RepID=A0A2A4MR67_9GAMM|nr:MAG: 4a-hydroxytetrahydrobiopterin dehydratase [SAR86 cluster bacterium]
MDKLYQQHCQECGLGSKPIDEQEAYPLVLSVPAWKRGFHEGVEKLSREFYFIEFSDAYGFTYKLLKLSERENHHPAILTEFGKVTVYWWSHKINGLHLNDYIMAAKTDWLAKLSNKE